LTTNKGFFYQTPIRISGILISTYSFSHLICFCLFVQFPSFIFFGVSYFFLCLFHLQPPSLSAIHVGVSCQPLIGEAKIMLVGFTLLMLCEFVMPRVLGISPSLCWCHAFSVMERSILYFVSRCKNFSGKDLRFDGVTNFEISVVY